VTKYAPGDRTQCQWSVESIPEQNRAILYRERGFLFFLPNLGNSCRVRARAWERLWTHLDAFAWNKTVQRRRFIKLGRHDEKSYGSRLRGYRRRSLASYLATIGRMQFRSSIVFDALLECRYDLASDKLRVLRRLRHHSNYAFGERDSARRAPIRCRLLSHRSIIANNVFLFLARQPFHVTWSNPRS